MDMELPHNDDDDDDDNDDDEDKDLSNYIDYFDHDDDYLYGNLPICFTIHTIYFDYNSDEDNYGNDDEDKEL